MKTNLFDECSMLRFDRRRAVGVELVSSGQTLDVSKCDRFSRNTLFSNEDRKASLDQDGRLP